MPTSKSFPKRTPHLFFHHGDTELTEIHTSISVNSVSFVVKLVYFPRALKKSAPAPMMPRLLRYSAAGASGAAGKRMGRFGFFRRNQDGTDGRRNEAW